MLDSSGELEGCGAPKGYLQGNPPVKRSASGAEGGGLLHRGYMCCRVKSVFGALGFLELDTHEAISAAAGAKIWNSDSNQGGSEWRRVKIVGVPARRESGWVS